MVNLGFGENEGNVGVDEKKNLITLLVVMLVPFYFIMFGAVIIDSMAVETQWTILFVAIGAMAWILSICFWYVKVKSTITSFYCFEGAKVHYDENFVATLDMKFYPEEMKRIGVLPSGREAYMIPFLEEYGYNHPELGNLKYNKAFIILPFPKISFKQTFAFRSAEELWHSGMLAECPNCEGASFHVSPDWDEIEGEWVPTFTVANSHIHYIIAKSEMIKLPKDGTIELPKNDKDDELTELKISEILNEYPTNALEILQTKNAYVKAILNKVKIERNQYFADREKLLKVRGERDEQIVEEFYDSNKRLMNMKPSTKWKILNLKALLYLGVFVLACGFLYVLVSVFG